MSVSHCVCVCYSREEVESNAGVENEDKESQPAL